MTAALLKTPGGLLSLLVVLAGCGGGETCYPVRGRVTLDGHALPDALVFFIPKDPEGRAASAMTDSEGRYELEYVTGQEGVPAGTYEVRITTGREGKPEADPPIPTIPERVPARFNLNTELVREVDGTQETFDFELDSGGQIIQPGAL